MQDTVRRVIARKRRLFFWTYVLSMAGMFVLLVATMDRPTPGSLYIAMALVLGCLVSAVAMTLISCPRCKVRLPAGLPTRRYPGFAAMQFCPYCGVGMDAPASPDR